MIYEELFANKDDYEKNVHWVHCHLCYELYIKRERTFFLHACDHVTCETCSTASPTSVNSVTSVLSDRKCPVCEEVVSISEINNDMPQQMKKLFHPNPWQDEMPAFHVLQFQQKQQIHLYQGMIEIAHKIMAMEDEIAALRVDDKPNQDELDKLRLERKEQEREMCQIAKRPKTAETAMTEEVQQMGACSSATESGNGCVHDDPIGEQLGDIQPSGRSDQYISNPFEANVDSLKQPADSEFNS
ncbi:RING finger protein vilya-like [Teleopsis dalmanni]|uniref:RING finger protein vilya-like n=1 Tax=Teleopsis dalmanni TaxID=139649 RepID=UPI0018CD2276|nr:RING finger protein vilya-like [Teleopsis dalmanni]